MLESLNNLARSYVVTKNGKAVERTFFSLADTYSVGIDPVEDHAFILALVLVVDQVGSQVDGDG